MLAEATDSADLCRFICPEVPLLGVPVINAGRDCLLRELEVEETEEVPIDDTWSDSLDALVLGGKLRGRGLALEDKWSLGARLLRVRGVPPRGRLALLPLALELSESSLAPLLDSGASSLAGTLRWRMRGVDAKRSLQATRPLALEMSETWLALLCETATAAFASMPG